MTKLLTPKSISSMYGLSLPNAYRIMHVHGIKIGRQFYIASEKLHSILSSTTRI